MTTSCIFCRQPFVAGDQIAEFKGSEAHNGCLVDFEVDRMEDEASTEWSYLGEFPWGVTA